MDTLYRNSRAVLYFCPDTETQGIDPEDSTLHWKIDHAKSLQEVRNFLGNTQYNVGLMHVDQLAENEITEVEEILISNDNISWVALARDLSLQNDALCAFIKQHFVDYFRLPLEHLQLLDFGLEHANGMAYLRKRAHSAEPQPEYEMVGSSEVMLGLFRSIRKVAGVDAPLLITGESGTGKEMIARAVHERSPRADGPFIAVNCGALPDNLIQSELFGYEKGAFTGATSRKIGRIEAAEGGTLFLDEIGDLPLDLQVNLLRFLQEKTIDRVGGTEPIPVDVRVVAATHVDLNEAIESDGFREDLYYRLNVLSLNSPPLRERGKDIELLAHYFFKLFISESPHKINGFTRRSLTAMSQYNWPGNVRELINRIRRAIVMCEGKMLTHHDLNLNSPRVQSMLLTLDEARTQAEKDILTTALDASHNNVSEASRVLGVSRVTMYRLMRKYHLEETAPMVR